MKFRPYIFSSYIYYSKFTFIRNMKGGKLLDIGCGNHSPSRTKIANPSVFYVGVDINKYNIDENDIAVANEIHFFDVETFFNDLITKIDHKFNYIICAHLIEHIPDKELLFKTIKSKLVKGGLCYITTPDVHTVNFPSSKGCLNYYDDPTHVNMPLTFQNIHTLCDSHNLRLVKFNLRNSSVFGYLIGLAMEPFRALLKRNMFFTWLYWGFEDLYIIENAE